MHNTGKERKNTMPYVSNPFMGKVRRLAVNDVRFGRLNQAEAARKYGVTPSAIHKWIDRADPDHRVFIETLSSRPKHHPHELSEKIVARIIELRDELKRCAPVIHAHMVKEGYIVSLASVGRVIARCGLTRKRKRAPWGSRIPRPLSDKPGVLVEIDTMHIMRVNYSRFYIYAVIDIFSRLGYAMYTKHVSQTNSVSVIDRASQYFGFPFSMVQSDNGPEFKEGFKFSLNKQSVKIRHSRIRRPNDNAHIERFIRTIQDECFKGRYPNENTAQKQLTEYLEYYNEKRLHLSLGLQTPRQFVSKVEN